MPAEARQKKGGRDAAKNTGKADNVRDDLVVKVNNDNNQKSGHIGKIDKTGATKAKIMP